jgi:hypothetical protein
MIEETATDRMNRKTRSRCDEKLWSAFEAQGGLNPCVIAAAKDFVSPKTFLSPGENIWTLSL